MDVTRKAEILHVLQEKYVVLKRFNISGDLGQIWSVDDFDLPTVINFDHGLVLDAIWEWMKTKTTYRCKYNQYWVCWNAAYGGNAERFIGRDVSYSDAPWYIAEWILQQKGELK